MAKPDDRRLRRPKSPPCSSCGSTLWQRRRRCGDCRALVCGACLAITALDHGGPTCRGCVDARQRKISGSEEHTVAAPPVEVRAAQAQPAEPEPELVMHRIADFRALRSRHDVYQRELEQLAVECERLLPVLKGSLVWALTPEGERERCRGIKYVSTEIEKRLKKILLAAEVDGPREAFR